MTRPLRVLILEDREDDAELVLLELRRGGFVPEHLRVGTAGEFAAALDRNWDVIVADFTLPSFSGIDALTQLRARGLPTPFIFILGSIGEEVAVAARRADAQDYIFKEDLKRLVPTIERELRKTAARHEKEHAEAERERAKWQAQKIITIVSEAIVAVDSDQRIVIFNPAAESLFGYASAEAIGQPLELLLPLSAVGGHRRHVENFAGGPVATRWMNERGTVTGRRRDGTEFAAEVSIAKFAEEGRSLFIAVVRDITKRRRIEAELHNKTQLLSAVINQMPHAIVAMDMDRRLTLWNPAAEELFGFTAGEALGQRYDELLVPAEERQQFDRAWKALHAAEPVRKRAERRLHKNGRTVDVEISGVGLSGPKGEFRGSVGMLEDVTEQRAIQRQLQQAQRLEAVGQMTGGLAHDFNNLLAIVIGNLDLIVSRLDADPDAKRMADAATAAALRGADLTRQMLAFARRQSLSAEPIDLNAIVANTIDLLRRTLGEQIEIRLDLAEGLWPTLADPSQVESAVVNLALNARDAMAGGGVLTIETANKRFDAAYAAKNVDVKPGDYTMLVVSDTGAGIAPEILDRVFDPFFTTKEPGKGTGLGLAMVYGFAKQSGGHVKIYSEIDCGTSLKLYLPRADAPVAHERLEAGMGPIRGNERVLLVEDNPGVRETAVAMLEELGYRVRVAAEAEEALGWLDRGEPVDLLFTDIVMPGVMNGRELAAEAAKRRPGLKVLFTTGFAEAAVQNGNGSRNGKGLQPHELVIGKPYRKSELARMLRRAIETARNDGGKEG